MATKGVGQTRREARLGEILAGLAGDDAGSGLIERTIGLFSEIHDSDQDEKDKLKEKDKALILLIRRFSAQREQGKDWMLPGLYKLLLTLGAILVGIEEIFWELKKLPGKPPWENPGDGEPTPTPGGGPRPDKRPRP